MLISKLSLTNIRGYKKANMKFSPTINIIVGENNSGKTTILKSIFFIQNDLALGYSDVRLSESQGDVLIEFDRDIKKYFHSDIRRVIEDGSSFNYRIDRDHTTVFNTNINSYRVKPFISNKEPNNLIYPFLSKRKVAEFNEQIGEQFSSSVLGTFSHLSAKVDRLISAGNWMPETAEYIDACNEILGFPISSFPSEGGKKAAYVINKFKNISLAALGEGVANVLGLVLDLCMAEDKIFLIEEPENDIHPKALKKVLNLILEKSKINQFIITTHSNIVLKYLGVDSHTKIFNVRMGFIEGIPTSTINEVDNSSTSRKQILEDLGYELLDFDISDTWLILEESSAEAIIKDFLIPEFAPSLKDRLKICASTGVDKVTARFDAIHSLCLFFHLQKPLNDRIWVLVDGGEKEKKIIEDLKNKYKSWNPDRFLQFKEHDFENYYPENFKTKFKELLTKNSNEKREGKRSLVEEVKLWCKNNRDEARESFSQSASEVINILKDIEKNIQIVK
ncbi:MAG TPA: AAA family ATPase [Phormidium sp.]